MLLGVILCIAAICDITSRKIPNYIIIVGVLSGIINHYYRTDVICYMPLLNAIVVLILLYPIFYIRGIGAGDVKLFMVIGIYIDIRALINIIISSFMIAGVLIIIRALLRIIDGCLSNQNITYSSLISYNKRPDKNRYSVNIYNNTICYSIPILISYILECFSMLVWILN